MESPGKGPGRRRNGASGVRRAHRSASNHSSSSTSSDILVAPGPPTTASVQPSLSGSPKPTMMAKGSIRADVRDGRMLVVRVTGGKNLALLHELAEDDARQELRKEHDRLANGINEHYAIKDEVNEDDIEGPNHRGTYSKAYVLQHPEIKWVHRGQGRYLPAAKGRTTNLKRSQSSITELGIKESPIRKLSDGLKARSARTSLPQRRGSWAAAGHSQQEPLSLSKRFGDAQARADDDLPSSRSSRRAKAVPTTEIERRSSRVTTQQSYNESDEDSDMAGDKEPTFDKDYVEAHPNEKFYHTGNGWYKRGDRPKGHKNAKRRDSEGLPSVRRRDGTYQFNDAKTIHVSQLDNFPGVEFHHCGNGWYKPGRDATGHRASRLGGPPSIDGDDEDEGEDGEDGNGVVSKDYTLRHPEIEWVHRGNGRYKRKNTVSAAPASVSESYLSHDQEQDQTIYSKAYVEAHPDETFHHRGNARYMRGPPPERWASARRRRSAPAVTATKEDDSGLFTKAYVEAHPNEVFHHRGQGRYARGPRRISSMEDDGEMSDGDMDGLVDTDYVEAHPNETFHHRGQGRWARGLPPSGASNKVAIRGPGARDRLDASHPLDEEDEANKPPAITALLLKSEGPDKWPNLTWYYRGGGKWGRVTKQEFEDIQRGGHSRRNKGKGRMKNVDGPEAQLEREAAAAAAQDDYGFQILGEMGADGLPSQERPKAKRRRTGRRGVLQSQEEGLASKQSSNGESQAPTPKPRMLEPEEDILTEEDLPALYRDDWSPASEEVDEQTNNAARNLYRAINPPEKFVKSLTKHDPAIRPLDNLKRLAANAQSAMEKIQQEYLYLERITAPHARIPRKPAKGGRVPVDTQIFEDRKEADLYDYTYDPRRIGFQDPQAQKIQRDAEGRELRNRRNRSGANNNGTLPGWNFGEDETLGSKRAVKPVNRFDGIVEPTRKRARNSTTATCRNSKAPSMTPDRTTTPLGGPVRTGYVAAPSARLTGNIPKRVRELRDDILQLQAGNSTREGSPSSVRKGRPPGSKNLHKRKDAGIKKGPRKPKVVDSIETSGYSDGEAEIEGDAEY